MGGTALYVLLIGLYFNLLYLINCVVPGEVGKPPPVSNDTLTSRSVVLRWSPPADPNGAITMYNISIDVLSNDPIAFMTGGGQGDRRKRQTSGDTNINTNCVEGGQMNVNRSLTLIGKGTSHTLTDLTPYSVYHFSVLAATSVGFGKTYSLPRQFITPESEPTAVLNLTLTPLQSTIIKVTWNNPECPYGNITHYLVYYREADNTQARLNISSVGYMQRRVPQRTDSKIQQFNITDLKPYTNYTVNVQPVVQPFIRVGREISGGVRNEVLTRTLSLPESTTFFQLRLTGITNCETWKTSDIASKDRDILNTIINNLDPRCGCVLNEDHFTNRGFQCFPSSPKAVTYRAELHGTHQVSVSELIVYLEEWISSEVSIIVQLLILSIDESCAVEITSIAEEECRVRESTTGPIETTRSSSTVISTVNPTLASSQSSSTIMIVVVCVVVLLIVVIITIAVVVIVIVRNHHSALNLQKETRSAPISAVQLSSFTPDPVEESHVYEDICEYSEAKTQPTTAPPPPVPASGKDEYELTDCPAYVFTNTQSSSTREESEDRQYEVVDL